MTARLRLAALLVAAGTTIGGPACAVELWPDLSQPPAAKVGTSGAKDAAVVIGIENYAFVEPVSGARRNADDWQAYLTTTRAIPFDRISLLRDGDATIEQIRRFAAEKTAEVEPGGTLWFVFIGHGAPSHDGKDGLLVGADAQANVESLSARSLSRRELIEMLSKGRQSRTVAVLDACFSGRASSGRPLAPGLQPLVNVMNATPWADERMILMTAARSDEYAGPLPKTERSRPAFSYLALGALLGWGAERNGTVTAGGVVRFAQRALTLAKDRTQTPELAAGNPATVIGEGQARVPDLARIDREGGEGAQAAASSTKKSREKRPENNGGVVEWVRIPGGTFTMGSANGLENERPMHRVAVEGFEMARSPVTNAQYQECVDAGVCPMPHLFDNRCMIFTPLGWRSGTAPTSFQEGSRPVVCVDLEEARIFSKWVGGRLPTEAEWEYAARGAGQERTYPWGEEPPTCARAIMNSNGPGCGRNETAPVCSKPAGKTVQGLCDMSGNVWEWVDDWYHVTYDKAPGNGAAWLQTGDPSGPAPSEDAENRSGFLHLVRGGSWRSNLNELRSARRLGNVDPRALQFTVGFRPVRMISATQSPAHADTQKQ